MAPSRRSLQATAALTEDPPDLLPPSYSIARVVKGVGNNLYAVKFPSTLDKDSNTVSATVRDEDQDRIVDLGADSAVVLVELPSRFRNRIWLRNGGFVVVDRAAFAGRGNKLGGEIVNVVRQERVWMQMSYWPAEFDKKLTKRESDGDDDDDDEESNVGKMPPSPEDSAGED